MSQARKWSVIKTTVAKINIEGCACVAYCEPNIKYTVCTYTYLLYSHMYIQYCTCCIIHGAPLFI